MTPREIIVTADGDVDIGNVLESAIDKVSASKSFEDLNFKLLLTGARTDYDNMYMTYYFDIVDYKYDVDKMVYGRIRKGVFE